MNTLIALSSTELLAIAIILTLKWVLPILVVIWIMRKLIANYRENKRLRLEVGKLAHALEQCRMHTLETGNPNPGASS
jgi:hypothetical protein